MINCMMISEETMTPLTVAIIYDHDIGKFLRKRLKGNCKITDLDYVFENIKEYEMVSDDEIIKMYYIWINSNTANNTNSIEFKVVENYVKSLNREEKLNDLGLGKS